jgi:hypothetical protein
VALFPPARYRSLVVKSWWFWAGTATVTTVVYGWLEVRRQADETLANATSVVTLRHEAEVSAPAPAEEYDIAPSGELHQGIRAGLAGTRSRCELGPASLEEQAKWAKLQEPRAHGSLASAELFALSDSDLFIEVHSRLLDKRYAVGLRGMSDAERTVALLTELEFEVLNGGFDQFFSNSSGNCSLQALAAARVLDAQLADIVARAVAQFPSGAPDEDRATRYGQMEAMPGASEVWSNLDRETPDDLSRLLERYIRAHRAQFDCPPQKLTD